MGGFEPPHLAQRKSGLYVPESAVERTLLASDFAKLKRMLRFAGKQMMVGRFFCRECKQPIALNQEDRLVQGKDGKALGGRIVLRCGCTVWRVK